MSEGLKVDFAELDRMTNGLTDLNAYALPLVPKVGAISADGDLLASAILSPGTAVAAESAVLTASVQLGVTVASTEALVVITASIVKVYQTAEAALVVAIPVVEAAFDRTLFLTLAPLTTGVVVSMVTNALALGVGAEGVRALAVSLWEAVGEASSWTESGGFATNLAAAFASNFSVSNASAFSLAAFQSILGSRGDLGYNTLLSLLVHEGHGVGLFDDGRASWAESSADNSAKKKGDLDDIAQATFGRPQYSDAEDYRAPLDVDANGNVRPRTLGQLWAGAAQIDGIGAKESGDVRVIRIDTPDGPRFVVQIPSTQVWDPRAGAVPNDLTSDVMAMRYGDSSALASSVREILRSIPEVRDGNAPVMLTGFSLGGITAGAIAADPQGLNVQQVVTAGSPIGRMDIPTSTSVTSFESREDPIARLDGSENPHRPGWNTIGGAAPSIHGEPPQAEHSFVDAHSATRYSVMAQEHPDVDRKSTASQFLDGDQTVTDYRVERQ
ncbi:hypothetical protein ACO0E1_02655 [Curtobacterium sp. RRHDQ66]|uniref:hypothetical protein n=1 Tax=Curtobacterium guangdongense TaxID=3413380 RepID=UPI003BEFF3E2